MNSVIPSWLNRYQSYVPLWSKEDLQTRRRIKGCTMIVITVLVIILIPMVFLNIGGGTEAEVDVAEESPFVAPLTPSWTKPEGLTVVAMVFYGRRQNVQILERYLRVPPRLY